MFTYPVLSAGVSSFASLAALQNPVAWYDFESTATGTGNFPDVSGNGRNLTLVSSLPGAAARTTKTKTNAATVTDDGDILKQFISGATNLTIHWGIVLNYVPGAFANLWYTKGGNNSTNMLSCMSSFGDGNYMAFQITSNTGDRIDPAFLSNTLNVGVIMTLKIYSGNQVKAWRNGVLQFTTSFTGTSIRTTAVDILRFSSMANAARWDEFIMVNSAVSDLDIVKLHDAYISELV